MSDSRGREKGNVYSQFAFCVKILIHEVIAKATFAPRERISDCVLNRPKRRVCVHPERDASGPGPRFEKSKGWTRLPLEGGLCTPHGLRVARLIISTDTRRDCHLGCPLTAKAFQGENFVIEKVRYGRGKRDEGTCRASRAPREPRFLENPHFRRLHREPRGLEKVRRARCLGEGQRQRCLRREREERVEGSAQGSGKARL